MLRGVYLGFFKLVACVRVCVFCERREMWCVCVCGLQEQKEEKEQVKT